MKIKKTSLVALFAAVAVVAGVTTAFATSAKPDDPAPDAIDTAVQVSTTISYVDPEDGLTYYSLDGGATYEAMTDEELAAKLSTFEIEWWTYEGYKAWLENEKAALQSLIGETAWTSGRGEFVWTQELVDEAVATYERILEAIKNGMLYSKTVAGGAEGIVISMNPSDIAVNVSEGPADAADFLQYAPYGLVWDGNEEALFWNGRRVRYFLDGAEIEDGMAIRLEYADAEKKGEIDVHTVRERVQNADGSYDPMGPLTGLEQYSKAGFSARTFPDPPPVAEITYALTDNAGEAAETGTSFAKRFAKYASFGIAYEEAEGASGAGNVYLNGKLVSRFADISPDGEAFTFTSADQGGLIVRTIYDGSGNLMRIETA